MRRDLDDYRENQEQRAITLRGLVRRVAVKLVTSKGFWQLLGYIGLADDERELFGDAEVFQHVGFVSRPKPGSAAEALVLNVGGKAAHYVVIGSRDKKTEITISDDETAIFNSTGAFMKVTKDGDIVGRCASGRTASIDDGSGAEELAKKSDLATLKTAINGAGVVAGDGGAAFKANLMTALSSWPVGTTVLKGK